MNKEQDQSSDYEQNVSRRSDPSNYDGGEKKSFHTAKSASENLDDDKDVDNQENGFFGDNNDYFLASQNLQSQYTDNDATLEEQTISLSPQKNQYRSSLMSTNYDIHYPHLYDYPTERTEELVHQENEERDEPEEKQPIKDLVQIDLVQSVAYSPEMLISNGGIQSIKVEKQDIYKYEDPIDEIKETDSLSSPHLSENQIHMSNSASTEEYKENRSMVNKDNYGSNFFLKQIH